MKRFRVEISKGRFKIYGLIQELGEDLLVSIWGGNRPHIGAIGVATPRPSLKDHLAFKEIKTIETLVRKISDQILKKIPAFWQTVERKK